MSTKAAPAAQRAEPVERIRVAPESWRTTAYIFFWSMCIFAICMAELFVVPAMAKGPETPGDPCGPFNRDAPDFGVHLGEGFDFRSQGHLIQLFGFANICANWDYSPSRELTAMVYPLFEYSLLIYLCLDFLQTQLSYKRGELTEWFYTFAKIVFPINIFLCAQFRMIFVCIAYQNVSQHTAGFLGLQISLILVALKNVLYVIDSNESVSFLGGIAQTRMAAIAYLTGLMAISSVKITATIFVVQNGYGAPWTLEPSPLPGNCVGQFVDKIWMIFNAVLPLIISYIRSKNEYPLDITITSEEPSYVKPGQEMKPLNKMGGAGLKYEASVQEAI